MLSRDITNLAVCDESDLLRPHILQLLLPGPRDPAADDNVQEIAAPPLTVVVAVDEEELEDPVLLPLGPIVEEQDPAVFRHSTCTSSKGTLYAAENTHCTTTTNSNSAAIQ